MFNLNNLEKESIHEANEIVQLDAIRCISPDYSDSDTPPVNWIEEALKIRKRLRFQLQSDNKEIRDPQTQDLKLKINEITTPISQNTESIKREGFLKKCAETYELENYRKNAMVIFNHESFLGCEGKRNYTMRDEEALETTFKKFRFTVDKHLDLTKEALLKKLKEFCSQDFSQYGCICAVVMTHGAKNGWLRAYDMRYSEHELIECFNVEKNITLLGKPVIIIIQACRGFEPATAVNHGTAPTTEHVELDCDEPYTLPTEADRLIFHSSYFGRASVRVKEGSWFIQTLCHRINTYAHLDDFETICRAVRKNVAIEKQTDLRLCAKKIVAKQMPVVTTCLTRLLYFKRCEATDDSDNINRNIRFLPQPSERVDKMSKPQVCQEIMVSVQESTREDYFDYLKKILSFFFRENPDDEVAQSILNVAENNTNRDRSARTAMVDLIRSYLATNLHRFTQRDMVYLRKERSNEERREERE